MNRGKEETPNQITNNYYNSYTEPVYSRMRDTRGREHYDNGRYAPMNRNWTITENRAEMPVDGYKRVYGFGADARYDMPVYDEMSSMSGSMERGYSSYDSYAPLTKQTAHEWVQSMKNSDGTTGEHWTMEQTTQLMQTKGITCDPVEFYAAINMMYSDYFKVAKKMNVNSVDFYAYLAEAFLKDTDAGKDKLAKYYSCMK